MNKKTGHISYGYEQNKNKVSAIGLSHKKNEKYGKMSKLKHNVNPNDLRDCYVKHKCEIYASNCYKKKPEYENYSFHEDDKPFIRWLIKKNKKK